MEAQGARRPAALAGGIQREPTVSHNTFFPYRHSRRTHTKNTPRSQLQQVQQTSLNGQQDLPPRSIHTLKGTLTESPKDRPMQDVQVLAGRISNPSPGSQRNCSIPDSGIGVTPPIEQRGGLFPTTIPYIDVRSSATLL